MESSATLGQRIQEGRKSAGLSQEALANSWESPGRRSANGSPTPPCRSWKTSSP